MATLATANLPSEDEEDQDFVPDEVDSEDEAIKKKNAPKKRKGSRIRGATVTAVVEEQSEEDETEKIIPEHKRLEKKAKMDELWSKLNQGSAAATKTKPIVNLAALCKPAAKPKVGAAGGDQSWMKQLGLTSKFKYNKEGVTAGNKSKDTKSVAAAALAAAKTAASVNAAQQYGMVTVTETRRFAGKTVTVQRDVDANSKEAKNASDSAAVAANKKSGLDAVLDSLAQAKKVTVLDKSKLDWKDYKKKDDKIDEELAAHKRSGATYLEKQAFLGRAEMAQYERERDQRLASDVRNRGRL